MIHPVMLVGCRDTEQLIPKPGLFKQKHVSNMQAAIAMITNNGTF